MSVKCLELALNKPSPFITLIKENIWKFLNEEQQIEASVVLDLEEHNYLHNSSYCDECKSSCNDHFDYYDGWKKCECSDCAAQRETEEYQILAEENEELEAMYYDYIASRYEEDEFFDDEELIHVEASLFE